MIYVFKRHKTTGRKTEVNHVNSEQEARTICYLENSKNKPYWYEFTSDREQIKNRHK